jgi:DNA polymerase V
MRRLSVLEIWGVATRLTKRLNALGLHSIFDLSRADPVMIRDRFSAVMMRTVLELQGTSCIPMEEERIGRDQLIFSRSFATPITTAAGMRQVMSVYGQQASARLARHGLHAKVLTAFAGTSHFNPKDTAYPSVCVALPMPTADPVLLTRAAHALLPHIHEGIRYAKAGIMVTDLRPAGNQAPLALFENPHEERQIGTLLEDVTRRYGRGSIGLGHAGIRGGPDWTMKRDMLSPPGTPPPGTNSRSSEPPNSSLTTPGAPRRVRRHPGKESPDQLLSPERPWDSPVGNPTSTGWGAAQHGDSDAVKAAAAGTSQLVPASEEQTPVSGSSSWTVSAAS